MRRPHDLLILGAGCAGLSLAMRLAESSEQCPRILLLEQRERYLHDRHWCFWDQRQDIAGQVAVAQRWTRFEVSYGARRVEHACHETPYAMVESGHFYTRALEVIASSPRIELRRGVTISPSLRVDGDGIKVPTSVGTFHAPYVLDTRVQKSQHLQGEGLWQSFLGYQVEVESALFEPHCVTLMDLVKTSDSALGFLYLIPRSSTCALFEWTVFDQQPRRPQWLEPFLERAIRQRTLGAAYKILFRESGCLPMQVVRAQSHGSGLVRCGLDSGMARASTGYAFSRIQAWSSTCAEALRSGAPPCAPPPDPPWIRAMDECFLKGLSRHSDLAAEALFRLFERTPRDRLIRFLSDRAGFLDALAVARALGPSLRPSLADFRAAAGSP